MATQHPLARFNRPRLISPSPHSGRRASESLQRTFETEDLTIRFEAGCGRQRGHLRLCAGHADAIVGPYAGKRPRTSAIPRPVHNTVRQRDAGRADLTAPAPRRAPGRVGQAFQLTNLFPNLSVLENVRLAVQATQRATPPGSTCGASGATTRD